MFALIIAIVSIALIVATVAATMYHGGDTLTQGRNKADAAAIVAGAQQIAGAQVMHLSLVGTQAADVAALVTADYLSSAPTAATFTLDTATRVVEAAGVDVAVCDSINQSAGVAADVDGKHLVADAAGLANLPYGCVTGGDFSFKY